jgi:NADPH-dependent 2,4-dienoyl-CoA reductase/sulfur reductase-like enzyme
MNPMLVVGEREPATTTRSISRLAERGVDFRRGEVTGLDLESREITTDTGVVPFDHLVVALGASYDWNAVPGSDSAHSFYSFDEAVRLRDEIAGLRGGTIVIAAARPPYKQGVFHLFILNEPALVGRPNTEHVLPPQGVIHSGHYRHGRRIRGGPGDPFLTPSAVTAPCQLSRNETAPSSLTSLWGFTGPG